MCKQINNSNLNYSIDPTFSRVNISFILKVRSFGNENDKTSFSKYFTPSVRIKDFNVLIDGKSFFDTPIKIRK